MRLRCLPLTGSRTFQGPKTGERSIEEGVTSGGEAGAPVTAIDADNDDLNYSLGGEDAGFFSIDSAGQIRYVGEDGAELRGEGVV